MYKLLSIMPLDTENIEEICLDSKEQIQNGIADCILFEMSLVPEGNTPIDKVKILCEKYDLFRKRLFELGVPNGILIQTTLPLDRNYVVKETTLQKQIGLVDGKEYNHICPYDEEYKKYMFDLGKTLALHNPEHIMVDDDYRLLCNRWGGCACDLHIKKFNEYAGTDLTREELLEIVMKDSEKAGEYTKIFCRTQQESLIDPIKELRAGIDSVNPNISGSFCVVGLGSENAYEIGKIIAGKDNPITVRINEGFYACRGGFQLAEHLYRAAAGIAKIKGKVDVILGEVDTCPQNRYSKSANTLHSHFIGSILEGSVGAKFWITRMMSWEPKSGKAYRDILSRYKKFYEKLIEITPQLKWRGFRMPIFDEAFYKLGKEYNQGEDVWNGWLQCVLNRLGLPIFFSSDNTGVACLEGKVTLREHEILELLRGTVILSSDSAQCLIERGFGEYLGVSVNEWTGLNITGEKIFANDKWVQKQINNKELVPINNDVRVDSIVCNFIDKANPIQLFPGTTMYKNLLGGTVYVFAGTPRAEFTYSEGFSFLNESRKEQLANILKEANELPAYYPNDAQVYMRTADMSDGRLFCAIFNVGMDNLNKLELCFENDVSFIEKLMPDGSTQEILFEKKSDEYVLDTALNVMEPVILFVE